MFLISTHFRKPGPLSVGALLLGVAFSHTSSAAVAECQPANEPLEEAVGNWRAEDGSPFLVVEPYRLLVKTEQGLKILPLRHARADQIVVVDETRRRPMPFMLRAGKLLTAHEPGADVEHFQRDPITPPGMEYEPLPLGDMRPLSKEQVQLIQKQLEQRLQRDQAALRKKVKQTEAPGEVKEVTKENTAYLLELVQDVGWIDRDRFGLEAAHRAAILTQHSGHVPLALAALPYVKKDFKGAHDSPETYAVFLDWLRLTLGDCQRYGSRIELDEEGSPVLAPLENAKEVDQIRAEQGMSSLDQYLDLAGKYLFDGQEIRQPEQTQP